MATKFESPYDQVISRKRKWTPVQVRAGSLKDGAEDALYRGLALRRLELPVATFLRDALRKDLPSTAGVCEALESNIKDEERHDLALQYVIEAHGTNHKAEREADHILKAWIEAPEHPILKAAILERSVFFVLLPSTDSPETLESGQPQQTSAETNKYTLPSTVWSVASLASSPHQASIVSAEPQ